MVTPLRPSVTTGVTRALLGGGYDRRYCGRYHRAGAPGASPGRATDVVTDQAAALSYEIRCLRGWRDPGSAGQGSRLPALGRRERQRSSDAGWRAPKLKCRILGKIPRENGRFMGVTGGMASATPRIGALASTTPWSALWGCRARALPGEGKLADSGRGGEGESGEDRDKRQRAVGSWQRTRNGMGEEAQRQRGAERVVPSATGRWSCEPRQGDKGARSRGERANTENGERGDTERESRGERNHTGTEATRRKRSSSLDGGGGARRSGLTLGGARAAPASHR